MTPRLFIDCAILPAYTLLPARMASRDATAMIVAICLQESRFEYRRQIARYYQGQPVPGPARGYAQFEMQGGIRGVLKHEATREPIRDVLKALDYDDEVLTSNIAIEHNDVLCAAYARLLLWTLPDPLPTYGQDAIAWDQYIKAWRPGKPHRETWVANFDLAWQIVGYQKEEDHATC